VCCGRVDDVEGAHEGFARILIWESRRQGAARVSESKR
jgi:hypothetical protein